MRSVGNVADALRVHADERPDKPALIAPTGRGRWESISYRELNERVDQFAHGFAERGIERGDRILFLVRPGLDFYTALFGLFRLGAVPILLDPGMGLGNVLKCVQQIQPRGVLALPLVHVIRLVRPSFFRSAKILITAGSRWFWGGVTLGQCRSSLTEPYESPAPFTGDEEGFIAFTSGSTGAPKGVSFLHRMFSSQASMLGEVYGLGPSDTAFECFAAFVIYDLLLGMTTVLADMDMSKPAKADPALIISGINEHKATTAFASPVVWANVVRHSQERDVSLGSLKRVLTAGAPISAEMHRGIQALVPEGVELHTPYGATESLPVATIGSQEVLSETWTRTNQGEGTCVGRAFPGVTVRLMRIHDEPLAHWSDAELVSQGEIGEIVVDGPIVSPEYKDRPKANAVSKINHNGRILHRIGDLGYWDDQDRLWFCGRKSHAVWTSEGMVPAVPVEGVYNSHAAVRRTALVGVGERGAQRPVLCVEMEPGSEWSAGVEVELEALSRATKWEGVVDRMVVHRGFPVDARHNSKIKREVLREWATEVCSDLLGETA